MPRAQELMRHALQITPLLPINCFLGARLGGEHLSCHSDLPLRRCRLRRGPCLYLDECESAAIVSNDVNSPPFSPDEV